MKIAYIDCIAGASGDMLLGALVDAGLPLETLEEQLSALHIPDFHLSAHRVAKNAFTATKVDVHVADNVPERHLGDILAVIDNSDLPEDIKTRANTIFNTMGRAEAGIHGTTMDHVHLHELGGVDTIVDVVGVLLGFRALGIEKIVVSPVPLGRGFIKGAHGQIPLPAPATISLLKDVPITNFPLNVETVTPTGAALLSALADDFGGIPTMKLSTVAYGAGSRDSVIPNLVRLLIGQDLTPKFARHSHGHSHGEGGHTHEHPHPHTHDHGDAEHSHEPPHIHDHIHDNEHSHSHGDDSHTHEHPHVHTHAEDGHTHEHDHEHPHVHQVDFVAEHTHSHTPVIDLAPKAIAEKQVHSCRDSDQLTVLETNIDDLNPETYDYVMEHLFEAGALDVFLAPIQMKKNRPATLLRVLCFPADVQKMTTLLFKETTTLGVREHHVGRYALPRSIHEVETPYGTVRVKVAELPGGGVKSAPEYDDCKRLADASGVPFRQVYRTAMELSTVQFGG